MRRGNRRGVNAAEFIVFTAMSMALIIAAYELLTSGSIVGGTTHQGLQLQQGIRNLTENLVKDVNASVFIGEPHGLTQLPAHKAVLWVYNDEIVGGDGGMTNPGKRLQLNDGPDGAGLVGGRNPWPFFHTKNPTRWHLPVMQVTYEWDQGSRTVRRTAMPGDLWVEATQAGSVFVDKISFQGGTAATTGPNAPRVMAENVDQFDLFPFGYNEYKLDTTTQLGEVKPVSELPDLVSGAGASTTPVVAGFGSGSAGSGGNAGTTDRIARTAMLLLHCKARFDYQSEKFRDPEVYLVTKIWSYTKLYEHMHFPYFSSVDDDLRF